MSIEDRGVLLAQHRASMERAQEELRRYRARYFAHEHREAVAAAYRAWRARRPWRWLPRRAHPHLFGLLGRGSTAAFIADWKTRFRREHRETLKVFLFSDEWVVLPPSEVRELRRMEKLVTDLLKGEPLPRAADPSRGAQLTTGGGWGR